MNNYPNMLDCSTGCPFVQKFGLNPSVDMSDPPVDLSAMSGFMNEAAFVFPFSFASDSALDTAAGTGMQQLQVQGIDLNGNFRESIHETNGMTPVALSDYSFINRTFGTRWGVTAFNQGTIDFSDSAGSPQIAARIPVSSTAPGFSFGQTLQTIFCIPLDWGPMIMTNRWAAVGRQAATQAAIAVATNKHRLFFPTAGFRVSATGEANTQGSNFISQVLDNCEQFEPLTIIRFVILEVTTNSTRVSGGFGLSKA